MYTVILSSRYRKSLKRILRHKDFDRMRFEAIVQILESGGILGEKYRDHELKGEFVGTRECHIQNDILLILK